MFLANVSESAKRFEDRFQTILTFDKVNILLIDSKLSANSKSEVNLYQRVWLVNHMNEFCSEYKQAMNENKLKFHIIKLKNCEIIDDVLFRKDLLWISENMHTKLLQEVHNQSSIFHLDNKWTIDLVQRFYYWSDHQATIRWYIWNCHAYQQSKVSKDSINELHHSLSILQKRWKDIVMNFITELLLSEDYNIICTIICCLMISSKNITMFSVIEKTMTSQSKKQFESCYETFIDCMIYSVLLFQIETLNLYSSCEKVFVSDYKLLLVYSLLIILKLMIKQSESIKTLNANLESTVITCRMIELNEYLWLSSVTMSIHSWSSQWSLSTSIKNFTFKWVLIQIQLTTKSLMNELKLEKQMILSFKWKSYWTSIVNNWKKLSWSLKLRLINIDETSSMR